MYKILITTDLSRLPKEVYRFVSKKFDKWSFDGLAEVYQLPPGANCVTTDLLSDCHAIISRPTDNFDISKRELFGKFLHTIHIYTVSVGISPGLKELEKNSDPGAGEFKIFNVKPASNARGVASFNIMLANKLFSRVRENSNNVAYGEFLNSSKQTSLVGKTWLLLGAGEQSHHLAEFAFASGVKEIIFANRKMEINKFNACLGRVRSFTGNTLMVQDEQLSARITVVYPDDDSRNITFRGVDQYNDDEMEIACRTADVVSVHLPYKAKSPSEAEPTEEWVDEKFLRKLAKNPILINTARGEVVNEKHIVAALEDGTLSGLAVDVLHSDIEKSSALENSPLWRYCHPQLKKEEWSKVPNVIITPHIAGAVDSDLLPMWETILKRLEIETLGILEQ